MVMSADVEINCSIVVWIIDESAFISSEPLMSTEPPIFVTISASELAIIFIFSSVPDALAMSSEMNESVASRFILPNISALKSGFRVKSTLVLPKFISISEEPVAVTEN